MSIASSFKPARLLRSHPRETAIFMLAGTAALVAIAGVGGATPTVSELATRGDVLRGRPTPLPAPPTATDLRDVAPEQAIELNARIPVATLPTTAARAFSLGKANAAARAQALECLTSAIYYEAGKESDPGQRGVAQVVLNRVRHPAYPSSVCGVVYQGSMRPTGCQFTFTCDGSLAHTPMNAEWSRARKVARAALAGAVFAPVGLATHYHANYVLPYWASSLVKTHVEGAHLFYRWAGDWGQATAFGQNYAAREASASALRLAALSVPRAIANSATAIAALDQVKGVEVTQTPGGRVTAHFSPQARAAVEAVTVIPYVERVAASDNLRRALDGAPAQGTDAARPLGRAESGESITAPAS